MKETVSREVVKDRKCKDCKRHLSCSRGVYGSVVGWDACQAFVLPLPFRLKEWVKLNSDHPVEILILFSIAMFLMLLTFAWIELIFVFIKGARP